MESFVDEMYDTKLEYKVEISNKPVICGICGETHSPSECNILKITNHIPDKVIPSRARLTLPDLLEIKKFSDCTYNVYTQRLIVRGTRFGPFQAKKLFTLHPSIEFPLKIFTNSDEDLSEYFLDTSDENECCWMIFIGPASDCEEQNLICYQEGDHLYYSAIKDIMPGEPLKVWYSPYYATKMRKEGLPLNTCEEDTVETKSINVETLLKNKKNIMPRDSWSCKFCGKVEKDLSIFALHLINHYMAQSKVICTICKESFLSRQRLNKHLRFAHGSNLKKSKDVIKDVQTLLLKIKDSNDPKETTTVGGPLLLNDLIPDSLDNSNLLLPQTDLSQFNLYSTDNQNTLLENENLNLNVDNILTENVKQLDHFNFEINESETEQLICDICLKSFVKLKSLIQHIQQHTGKFSCYECNKVFARKENLMYHACKSFYKIKCSLCERIFFQKKRLTQHIKVFHDKQFTCDKCNKFYDSKRNLETHNCPNVPISKKEKFMCNICSKIFFKKKCLDQHLMRHKNPKPRQQYVCALCNIILSSKGSYFKHAKLHEGITYRCDICNKEFRRSDALKVHKKEVHLENTEMVTCEVCNKQLKSKKLLNCHMESHRKVKSFKCPICQASFKFRSNFNKHTNKHKNFQTKFESLFQESIEVYNCPKCNKNMKLKTSLQRHMRIYHPDQEVSCDVLRPRIGKLSSRKLLDKFKMEDETIVGLRESDGDESVMDLKQTIENMNFNTDEVNNCSENNDINIEIDKILNNTDNIDNILSESSDQIVESLINIAAKENQLNTVTNQYVAKEVCLSMPDLSENDQEPKVGSNKNVRYLRFIE